VVPKTTLRRWKTEDACDLNGSRPEERWATDAIAKGVLPSASFSQGLETAAAVQAKSNGRDVVADTRMLGAGATESFLQSDGEAQIGGGR